LVGSSLGLGASASAAHSIGYSTTQFAEIGYYDPRSGSPMEIPPSATIDAVHRSDAPTGSSLSGLPSILSTSDPFYPGSALADSAFDVRYKQLSIRSAATADTGWVAYSDVKGSWSDTLTVSHPDLDGVRGLWDTDQAISFEGTGSARQPGLWEDLGEAKIEFTVSMKVMQAGFPDQEQSVVGGWIGRHGTRPDFVFESTPYGWGVASGGTLFPVNFEITYGEPFTFEVSLKVVSQVGTFLNPMPPTVPPKGGNAEGDFSHTLAWQGMGVLKDSAGNPLDGFTVESESGTDWLTAVPEPGTYALVTGLACIAVAWKRSRRTNPGN